jgi:hypothetical protein
VLLLHQLASVVLAGSTSGTAAACVCRCWDAVCPQHKVLKELQRQAAKPRTREQAQKRC